MTRFSGLLRLLVLITLVLAITGCGRFFQRSEPTETLPVEEMYTEAKRSLVGGNLGRAERYYTRLVARFPSGAYAEHAQIELAYTQYRAGKYPEATSTVNRFLRTYPTHEHIAYMYYLKGLINFSRDNAFTERIARLDMTQRDQSSVRQSFNDFAELIRRYPDSIYAADARQRMVYLRNQMAQHEINVGLFNYHKGAYLAAANRGQFVLETYPQSEFQYDAVALMGAAYARLGQDDLASDSRRVLQANDPNHPWLSSDWPQRRGGLGRLNPFAGGR